MQIVCYFKDHGNLSSQCPGSTNILLRDSGAVEPVKHAAYPQYLAFGAEQRNGQQLPNLILLNDFQIGTGGLAGLVGPIHFLGAERASCDAFRKNLVHSAGLS